ncbi:MAG: hypothetical protein J6B23_08835 [Clostridia bacterium]|nr:hypothetical protein [Clostridia bacterium]
MHKCEVRLNDGIPMLFVDGVPIAPMGFDFMSSEPDITNNIPTEPFMPTDIQLTAMAKADVRLYFIRTELRDPADFDSVFDKISRSVKQLKKNVENAYAVLWLIISPYEDFCNKYPNDVQTFDDGSVGDYMGNCSGRIRSAEIPRHTHASLAWRHETAGVLRRIVKRICDTPELADTVIGYFFFPLIHEANYFNDYDCTKKLDDYGFATKLAMRNYLAEKYSGDVSLLQNSWNNDFVTFENAYLPDRKKRTTPDVGVFWNPQCSMDVMDYAEIRSRVWADTLEYFARACKEESGYNAIVGSFWGYLINNPILWGGQGYFRQLMDSPYLDFWAGPFHYNNKGPGMSVTLRQLSRSLLKHKKMLFAEVDTTMSTSHPHERTRQGMLYADRTRDKELLKRDFSFVLTEGLHGWWTDFSSPSGLYDENDLLPTVRKIREIADSSLGKPMGSVAQIAAVTDQNSLFCMPCDPSKPFSYVGYTALEQPRLYEYGYLGAPIDHLELHDIFDEIDKYKMFVFQNAYLLGKADRDKIIAMKNSDKMFVFMYGQGFLSYDSPFADAENMSRLIGIKIRQTEGKTSGRIVLTKEAEKYGLTPGDEIGECDKPVTVGMEFYHNKFEPFLPPKEVYSPVFAVDDEDATVIGVYKDSGLPAMAIKSDGKCTNVYVGSAILNTRVLRALSKLQNITLYTEEDNVVYANESYIGVHAVKDGKLSLRFPEARAVREVFDGTVYEKTDKLNLELKLGDTRLFEYI